MRTINRFKAFAPPFSRSIHIGVEKPPLHGSPIEISGIKGELHIPKEEFKVHLIPKLLVEHWAQNSKFLKSAENTSGVDALNILSLMRNLDKRKQMPSTESIKHMCQHMQVMIQAFQSSTIPTMKQVQSLGTKHSEYVEQCKKEGKQPKSFTEFSALVFDEGRKQGLLADGNEAREHDVCLLKDSCSIDGFKYDAALQVYNEILYRNVHGPSAVIKVTEDTVLTRVEGHTGFEFFQKGSSGIFYSTGLPLQSSQPLSDGTGVHPIIAHAMIAIGVGARQSLTDKRLVLAARKCLMKMASGEEPTKDEKESFDKWMDMYTSGDKQHRTYLMEYHLKAGDLVGLGTATSPRGMITIEAYPIGFKPQNMQCARIVEGTSWPVFCSQSGKSAKLEITSGAKTHDLEVVIPSFDATPREALSASLRGTPEQLMKFNKMLSGAESELATKLEKHMQNTL